MLSSKFLLFLPLLQRNLLSISFPTLENVKSSVWRYSNWSVKSTAAGSDLLALLIHEKWSFFSKTALQAPRFSSFQYTIWICATIQFNYPRQHTLIHNSRNSTTSISEIFREDTSKIPIFSNSSKLLKNPL